MAAYLIGKWQRKQNLTRLQLRRQKEAQYFDQLTTLEQLHRLNPVRFEHLVKHLFEKMGYHAETTRVTGDGGVDLYLHKGDRLAVVQCKRYKAQVGAPVVRDLYGAMVHAHAVEAYIVTTATISAPAQAWAQGKPIHLVDGHTLVEWMQVYKETVSDYSAQ